MSGPARRQMANCPSAVPGAITRIEPTAVGIDVTVTAPTPEAERMVAARASLQQLPSAPTPFRLVPHTGMRTGTSHIGYCPTPPNAAMLTTSAVPGGVRIHLQAYWPWRVKELQDLVTQRAERLPGFMSS